MPGAEDRRPPVCLGGHSAKSGPSVPSPTLNRQHFTLIDTLQSTLEAVGPDIHLDYKPNPYFYSYLEAAEAQTQFANLELARQCSPTLTLAKALTLTLILLLTLIMDMFNLEQIKLRICVGRAHV